MYVCVCIHIYIYIYIYILLEGCTINSAVFIVTIITISSIHIHIVVIRRGGCAWVLDTDYLDLYIIVQLNVCVYIHIYIHLSLSIYIYTHTHTHSIQGVRGCSPRRLCSQCGYTIQQHMKPTR